MQAQVSAAQGAWRDRLRRIAYARYRLVGDAMGALGARVRTHVSRLHPAGFQEASAVEARIVALHFVSDVARK